MDAKIVGGFISVIPKSLLEDIKNDPSIRSKSLSFKDIMIMTSDYDATETDLFGGNYPIKQNEKEYFKDLKNMK